VQSPSGLDFELLESAEAASGYAFLATLFYSEYD